MKNLVPQISAVGWASWILTGIVLAIVYPSWSSFPSAGAVLQTVINFGVKGAGVVLSFQLARRPHRGVAFILAGICLFAFWRFFIGEVVFHMHPQMGGLSFGASLADWWLRTTSSTVRAVIVLPFAAFVTASVIVWPFYGLLYGSQSDDHAA